MKELYAEHPETPDIEDIGEWEGEILYHIESEMAKVDNEALIPVL